MRLEREYRNGEKYIHYDFIFTDPESPEWNNLSPGDKEGMLQLLSFLQRDMALVRRKILSAQVKTEPSPGLSPEEVVDLVEQWFLRDQATFSFWDSIWVNEKTGEVAYSQYNPPANADGYIKGFQLAHDIRTNKMVARNCDNIWKSLAKKGYTRIETLEQFQKFYNPPK